MVAAQASDEPYVVALRFAAADIPVFPVWWPDNGACACASPQCGSPGKHPLTDRGCRDATTDAAQMERWKRLWPEANWGAATGGYTVLDADSPGAHAAFAEAEEPAGLIVTSGGGGGHHWFSQECGRPSAKMLGAALDYDVRTGSGAYVLLPGSRHVTGNLYEVEAGSVEDIGPAPDWVRWLGEGIKSGGHAFIKLAAPLVASRWPSQAVIVVEIV